ncbi:MAG: glycine--tRNA ligase subunit beta [Gammaproteobacteria bacterium]|nr:glycine--tRNA ligase subunit beta [Gammaproteobacteria bacterium]
MIQKPFLVEVGTEELPPKALSSFSAALSSFIATRLQAEQLPFSTIRAFCGPRRLAVLIEDLAVEGATKQIEKRGPAVKSAFDAQGRPLAGAIGFADSFGVKVEELERVSTPQGDYLWYRGTAKGVTALELMPALVSDALKQLPIPKMMRWGGHDFNFVRPVHWLVLMHGSYVIPAEMFGVTSGKITYGHRFHHPEAVELNSAEHYVEILRKVRVLADLKERVQMIRNQAEIIARELKASPVLDDVLLNEVASIVEWPVALLCHFDSSFLKVPKEGLISAMQGHQKCFPLVDAEGNLLPHFIAIANIESRNSQVVIEGNQKVMSARLSDAAFFFDQDLKTPLEQHLLRLEKVTFQARLGSLADKTRRVTSLAEVILQQLQSAEALPENPELSKAVSRAGLLSKTDLMTHMVGEFPELQGLMGQYYSALQGESQAVSQALFEQYLPRFSGDELPQTKVGIALSLADKIDTLVGIFGIGEKPSGSKDPFGLRRAMIGVIRMLIQHALPLDLSGLFAHSELSYQVQQRFEVKAELLAFCAERVRTWYHDQGVSLPIMDAVLAKGCDRLDILARRVEAVQKFKELPEASSLASSNKRVQNILKKVSTPLPEVSPSLLIEPAEKALWAALLEKERDLQPFLESGEFTKYLLGLSGLKTTIDVFFEKVMVMAEEPSLQQNRLALLSKLHSLFFAVADLSKMEAI